VAKLFRTLPLLALLLAPLGCDYWAVHLNFSGQLVVYVHDDNLAVRGTVLEIVETGDRATTDASGLAQFTLAPGVYTVRAHGLRRDPARPSYVDQVVQVDRDDETRIDIGR
jgi:hypothetical protein